MAEETNCTKSCQPVGRVSRRFPDVQKLETFIIFATFVFLPNSSTPSLKHVGQLFISIKTVCLKDVTSDNFTATEMSINPPTQTNLSSFLECNKAWTLSSHKMTPFFFKEREACLSFPPWSTCEEYGDYFPPNRLRKGLECFNERLSNPCSSSERRRNITDVFAWLADFWNSR